MISNVIYLIGSSILYSLSIGIEGVRIRTRVPNKETLIIYLIKRLHKSLKSQYIIISIII